MLSRGVFIHLWACHCDIVSALLKAIHLTFKPSDCLRPPADPSFPRLTFWQGAYFPLRLEGGIWHHLCSGSSGCWLSTRGFSSPGRISAFLKFDTQVLQSLPAVSFFKPFILLILKKNFFFFWPYPGIWKSPGQGLNLSSSCGNAGSLTHYTGLGIEPASQQKPELLQRQCQIPNLLHHGRNSKLFISIFIHLLSPYSRSKDTSRVGNRLTIRLKSTCKNVCSHVFFVIPGMAFLGFHFLSVV